MDTFTKRCHQLQYTTGVERFTRMNAPAPAIRVQDTQEKHRHYGFAQVPRLITRGTYKTLSLIEKGLYTCLKDICGDAGECFYTLRRLAEEISTSISTLSRYIPKLIARGLIAATKKPGTKNKHEIYHIAIVDIWQENDATYKPKTVSDSNKVEDGTQESVSDSNNPSNIDADSNNNPEIVSSGNKDCFYLNDRVITSPEEESVHPSESVSEHISSTSVDDDLPPYEGGYLDQATRALLEWLEQETNARFPDIPPSLALTAAQEAKLYTRSPQVDNDTPYHIASPKATRKKPVKPKAGGLSLQGQHWLLEYQKFKGRKSTPGKATIDAANGLAHLVASDEEFTAVLTEIRDNKYLNDNNIARDLDFVFRKYERYRDIVEQKSDKKTESGVRLIGGKPSSELTDMEIDALPTPFLRKAARAARASC